MNLTIDPTGRIQTVKLARWGNPGGGEYRYEDFGVMAEAEKTFGGYTIPGAIRAGWFFGTDRFANEGEFFRATIDDAEFR